METINLFMGRDHERLDKVFKDYLDAKRKDPVTAKKLFSEFKYGLIRHIAWEEDTLFNIFENKMSMNNGPTTVMRQEHELINDCLKKINHKLENNDFNNDEIELELLSQLKVHNEKEEFILYPSIDRCLNDIELKKILDQFRMEVLT